MVPGVEDSARNCSISFVKDIGLAASSEKKIQAAVKSAKERKDCNIDVVINGVEETPDEI